MSTMRCAGIVIAMALSCAGAREFGDGSPGRLTARPHTTGQCQAGLRALDLDAKRDAILYVPPSAAGTSTAPFLLLLHGSGGSGAKVIDRFRAAADANGVILLAPDSRGSTWDSIRGRLGPDVAFIERALDLGFAQCSIDPSRTGVAGFSDGASYALTLGIVNGDLFRDVIAFSPCVIPGDLIAHGRPRFFISHGRQDDILPIDNCGRRLAAGLKQSNYKVHFEEFDGRHEVPPAIGDQAFRWFVNRRR